MEITHRIQLPSLMKYLKLPLKAVEVGVAEGLFSRDLLENGIELLFSVDAWSTLNQKGDGGSDFEWHKKNYLNAVKLLKPFGFKSIILKGISYEMAKGVDDNTLGLAYVDCDHSYEAVKKDIEAWYPKLVSGGIMAFHDYLTYDGVKMAVTEFAVENSMLINMLPENEIKDAGCWLQKK